jgi:hypothetical protein
MDPSYPFDLENLTVAVEVVGFPRDAIRLRDMLVEGAIRQPRPRAAFGGSVDTRRSKSPRTQRRVVTRIALRGGG